MAPKKKGKAKMTDKERAKHVEEMNRLNRERQLAQAYLQNCEKTKRDEAFARTIQLKLDQHMRQILPQTKAKEQNQNARNDEKKREEALKRINLFNKQQLGQNLPQTKVKEQNQNVMNGILELTTVKSEVDSQPEYDERTAEEDETYTDFQPPPIPNGMYTEIHPQLPTPIAEIGYQHPQTSRLKRKWADENEDQVSVSTVEYKSEKKDECDLFGELIAHKLRKLQSDRVRSNVEHVINGIMWDAGLGKYDNYHNGAGGSSHSVP